MSNPQVTVAPRKTVLLPGNRRITEGNALPSDHGLSMVELDKLVVAGYLVPFRVTGSTQKRTQKSQKPKARDKSPRKWNRDPRSLEGRTLDELNVLIGEIDTDAPVASTIEEATAVLSSEYDESVDGIYQVANNGGIAAGVKAVSFITEGPEEGDGQTSEDADDEGDPSVPNNEANEDRGD